MRKRAEHVEETRQRIVEAAVRLHGTIGPVRTTVAGIAREAGVTRVTVYRHFPDDDAIFAACSAHWLSGQVLPDPAAWVQIDDPVQRLRAGLTDLYRFYREGAAMQSRINRDRDALPEARRRALAESEEHFRAVLLERFGSSDQRLRALMGHAVSFTTWRSLHVEQGLSDVEVVDLMVGIVVSAAGCPPRPSGASGPAPEAHERSDDE